MKTINYTGPSKLIRRIVYLLNRKAPLPLDGDGDPSWGTNGQVLTTDGTGATYWSAGGGSGDVTDVKVNGTSVVDANKVANVTVPTQLSDLTNDTGFITNTVNNLTNYYLSSNTYTKTEVDSLISAIVTLNVLVVQSLPVSDISTTTIYLVPKSTPDTQDVYDEYINLDGTSSGWEHIGSTQIDLSNYYTKTEINALLSAKANTADLATVATSGDYSDLSNTPTIPAAQIQSDWNQSDSSAVDYIKNKPSIPSGGDTVSWTQVQQSGTKIAEIDINGSTQDVYAPNGGSTYTEGDGIDITNNEISVDTAFTEASTRANIASGDTLATIWGKIKKFFSDLKTVAFTGSYNDLTDKPSVPGGENYVLKAGDTMTGALTIQNVGDAIEINRANSSTYSGWLTFKNSSGVIGQYSVDQNGRPRYIANNDSSDIKQIALTSDIPDISTKVSKSGDTMSGTLNMATINGVAVNFRSNSNNYDTTISYQTAGNEACVFATKQGVTSWIFINGEDSITNHANTRWQSLTPGLQIKNNCVSIGRLIPNGTTPSYKLDVNGVVRATEFSGGIRDYYNSTPTFFGYSTSAMAQSDVTYLAAWDTSVSGQYRLRAVRQANLRVAYASSANTANTAGSAGTARSADYATVAGYIGSGTDYKCTMEVQATSLPCRLVLQSDYNLVLYKNGSAVWSTNTSSRRFKHNIQSMTEERARKILDVRAVTFDWNDGQPVTTQKCDNAGVIAEEVSQIIPDVVVFEQYDNDPNTRIERRVEYERFTPYLIKMVQMQQKQIDTMQATINALEQRLSKLEGK